MNTNLIDHQNQVIKKIGKQMAQAQAAYLNKERTCLTEFARVIGYGIPDDASMLVSEGLLDDERSGRAVLFNDAADWSRALTRYALVQLRDWANEEIEIELKRLEKKKP